MHRSYALQPTTALIMKKFSRVLISIIQDFSALIGTRKDKEAREGPASQLRTSGRMKLGILGRSPTVVNPLSLAKAARSHRRP